jgi:hypothetical protein
MGGRHGAPVDEARAGVGCRERERDGSAAGGHPKFFGKDRLPSPVLSGVSPRIVARTTCRAIIRAVRDTARRACDACTLTAQRRIHGVGGPRKRRASGTRGGGALAARECASIPRPGASASAVRAPQVEPTLRSASNCVRRSPHPPAPSPAERERGRIRSRFGWLHSRGGQGKYGWISVEARHLSPLQFRRSLGGRGWERGALADAVQCNSPSPPTGQPPAPNRRSASPLPRAVCGGEAGRGGRRRLAQNRPVQQLEMARADQ